MNLTFLGLCLACFGVSLAEGLMMSSLLKSASRQPEIIGQLRSLLILGVAFVEGTFFVTLLWPLLSNRRFYFRKGGVKPWKKVSINDYSWTCIF